jgi:hypothetical protein
MTRAALAAPELRTNGGRRSARRLELTAPLARGFPLLADDDRHRSLVVIAELEGQASSTSRLKGRAVVEQSCLFSSAPGGSKKHFFDLKPCAIKNGRL